MKQKCGLVLEGGAMRGMFTCGVLDVLMENGIDFDGIIGVSAGAIFGTNFKSRQPGRAIRYNLKFANDKRYCSIKSLLTTGNLYNAKFCYDTLPNTLDIFDYQTFEQNPQEFYIVATDIKKGEPVYYKAQKGDAHDLLWLRASGSMPLVSKPVTADGYTLLDGGISDSIPLKHFQSLGYTKNIVILTQPRAFVKQPSEQLGLMKLLLHKYPALIKCMKNRHNMYNSQKCYVFEQEKLGNTLVICPEKDLGISRTEKDVTKLQSVYDLGRLAAQNRLLEIRDFIKNKQKTSGEAMKTTFDINSRKIPCFGVAGNFTEHLEQAGEAKDFENMKTAAVNAPKAVFPTFIPVKQALQDSAVPQFLTVFPFDAEKIIFPAGEQKLQIEPECAIICSACWKNGELISLTPEYFAASNDCSIRKEGAKKISLKKNWGNSSKGLSEKLIKIDSFTKGGILDDYRIASFLIRDGKCFDYGEDSRVQDYSYIYEKLTEWLIQKFNSQMDEGPAENIHQYLKEADYPQQLMISIGATRYTAFGESNFLKNGDTTAVILYPESKYTNSGIKEMLKGRQEFPSDISVLKQQVVL